MTGIVIGSAALIIVLSAFNGFESLVKKLYGTFYPDISISLAEGKVFVPLDEQIEKIGGLEGVAAYALVLEENALLAYDGMEHIATIKGVDSNHSRVVGVADSVFIGKYILKADIRGNTFDAAVMGLGVASMLGVNLGFEADPVQVFMPKRSTKSTFSPQGAFRQKPIHVSGVFRIQQEFDSKYMLVPLDFLQSMLDYDEEISAIEIRIARGANPEALKKDLRDIMGPDFIVNDRYQQNKFLYKVMRTEKWAVYLVLTFILIIAAFNMIGSISMLVIEKKKDIGILRSLGANSTTIRRIFLMEGMLQTMLSTAIGFSIALTLCLLQMKYGFIEIPGQGTFVVSAYPVNLQLADFLLVFTTIIVIGLLASWFPAYRASRQKWILREE